MKRVLYFIENQKFLIKEFEVKLINGKLLWKKTYERELLQKEVEDTFGKIKIHSP